MGLIIPILLLALVVTSFFRGSGVYDSFVRGARGALPTLINVMPYMAAMLCALNVMRDSGALDFIVSLLTPAMGAVGVPAELTPLIVLRPFSGGAALALLDDVFKIGGVDSSAGYIASVMLGSTETIFYTVSLYFGSIGVKKTRYSVPVALLSGAVGIWAAVVLGRMFF